MIASNHGRCVNASGTRTTGGRMRQTRSRGIDAPDENGSRWGENRLPTDADESASRSVTFVSPNRMHHRSGHRLERRDDVLMPDIEELHRLLGNRADPATAGAELEHDHVSIVLSSDSGLCIQDDTTQKGVGVGADHVPCLKPYVLRFTKRIGRVACQGENAVQLPVVVPPVTRKDGVHIGDLAGHGAELPQFVLLHEAFEQPELVIELWSERVEMRVLVVVAKPAPVEREPVGLDLDQTGLINAHEPTAWERCRRSELDFDAWRTEFTVDFRSQGRESRLVLRRRVVVEPLLGQQPVMDRAETGQRL